MRTNQGLRTLLAAGALAVTTHAGAVDVVTTRNVGAELAMEIALKTLEACREDGYQVAVAVVDRGANVVAVLRDAYATRFSTEIARRKANAVVMAGVSTAEFARNRADIRRDLNEIHDIIVLAGALPIQAGGSLIGAVGVSGAPGGDKDEACARAALEAVGERLEFLDDE
jgi:uncharacterized protein GlcG (DUF336 family)